MCDSNLKDYCEIVIIEKLRKCKICGYTRPITEYYRNYPNYCKICAVLIRYDFMRKLQKERRGNNTKNTFKKKFYLNGEWHSDPKGINF